MPRLLKQLVARSEEPKQDADPYSGYYAAEGVAGNDGQPKLIQPDYCLEDLAHLPGMSSVLGPCIAAMVTNCELTGHTLVYTGKEGGQNEKDVLEEKHRIEALLAYPNPDEPFIMIREKVRIDYESVGWAAIEVTRDREGNISAFYHVPAHSLRMTIKDGDFTTINSFRYVGDEVKEYVAKKRFRRWAQLVAANQLVYFREFSDPRPILSKTGGVGPKSTARSDIATELIIFSQFTPGFAYALPRYINQIPAILGSREAELTNLHFFKDNAIPAMAILVSGGYLTDETVKNLTTRFKANRGRKSFNKVLVVEAQVDEETRDASDGAPEIPHLEFKTLSHDRQQDALFLEYEKSNSEKIRSSFRIPPIFVGLTSDYTRATATASLELAENQVFSPERSRFDAIFNTTLLLHNGRPPKYWKFRSNGGKVVGAATISETLMRLEKVGACTPNIAIQMARSFLNIDIEDIGKEWGDMPFEFSKALLKNGNMGIEGEFIENSLRHPASVIDPVTGAAKPGASKPKPDNDMGFGKKSIEDDLEAQIEEQEFEALVPPLED